MKLPWQRIQPAQPPSEDSLVILGIDVGGSGIKAAPVDVKTGQLLAERYRIKTPKGAEPEPVAQVVGEIVRYFHWQGSVGIGFPAAVKHGIVKTAANISPKWIGQDADALFTQATACPCGVNNDADVAGLAEVHFGAGRGQLGTVIMITLGTGIGTGVIFDGKILPNTELGHIQMDGMDAEDLAADSVRQRENLSWKKYSKRLNRYLSALEALFWPDLFIIGGGISKQSEEFLPYLDVQAPILPAQLLNEAGIVGAALMVA